VRPNFPSFRSGAPRALCVTLCLLVGVPAARAAETSGANSGAAPAEGVAARLRDEALAGHNIAFGWVSELTSRFGPRPAGSVNERQAAEWAVARFKALGFENTRIESFPLTGWVRGSDSGQITAPVAQPLVLAALGESPPTPAGGLEGEVAIFANFEALKAAPAGCASGKIVLVVNRMVRTQDGEGYESAVAARTDGPAEAARCGALAFALRSVGTDDHRIAHTGTTRFVNGVVPLPAFALSGPDADQIERLAALGEHVRVRLSSSASYLSGAHSQNVMAEVRGREHPEQVVLLGAHLDSWDQGTGAIDDGTGMAIVTAAAKLIHDAGQRPRRTVRVVLYGSEEVAQPAPPGGAFGGHAYADNHRAELRTHVLAGESDTGSDRVYRVELPAATPAAFAQAAQRLLAPLGVLPGASAAADAGTDVGPSVEAGVPAFALNQDASRYFDIHHTADDTLDKVDPAQLDQNVAAWAALVWLAADSEVDFRAHAPAPSGH
jgi:carboxypeptidase Q